MMNFDCGALINLDRKSYFDSANCLNQFYINRTLQFVANGLVDDPHHQTRIYFSLQSPVVMEFLVARILDYNYAFSCRILDVVYDSFDK